MKGKLVIILLLLVKITYGQIHFSTEIDYLFLSDDMAYQNSFLNRENLHKLNSRITLIKQNPEAFELTKNVILDLIFKSSFEENELNVFSKRNGVEYSATDIQKRCIKDTVISCWSSDTMLLTYFDYIKKFKLYQIWEFDLESGFLMSKIEGITPVIQIEEEEPVDLFYVKFENKFEVRPIINNSNIVYIELRSDFVPISKNIIDKLFEITNSRKSKLLSTEDFEKRHISKGERILNPQEFLIKKYFESTGRKADDLNFIEGIKIIQYIFIDDKRKSINSQLLGFGFFYKVIDEEGKLKYYEAPIIYY